MTTPLSPVTPDCSQLAPNGSCAYAACLHWQFTEAVELIRGKIMRRIAGPALAHQRICLSLSSEVAHFLKRKRCLVLAAPFAVRLLRGTGNGAAQTRTVMPPDLRVVCDAAKLEARGCPGAPDWVSESGAPRPARLDTATKYELYAENEVGEHWLVFPREKAAQALVPDGQGDYQLVNEYDEPGRIPSHTLPELPLGWADVFAGV